MTSLPERFTDEMYRAQLRIEGRERHLVLLRFEGLHPLERWRREREYRRQCGTKGP